MQVSSVASPAWPTSKSISNAAGCLEFYNCGNCGTTAGVISSHFANLSVHPCPYGRIPLHPRPNGSQNPADMREHRPKTYSLEELQDCAVLRRVILPSYQFRKSAAACQLLRRRSGNLKNYSKRGGCLKFKVNIFRENDAWLLHFSLEAVRLDFLKHAFAFTTYLRI